MLRSRVRGRDLFMTLGLLGIVLVILVHLVVQLTAVIAPDPLTAAWHQAQAAGSYAFHADIQQRATPAATVANVGRSAQAERLYLEGATNLRDETMRLRLWNDQGSVLLPDSALELRLRDGRLEARQPGSAWEPIDDVTDAFAPQGDFLSYLQAVRDPQELGTETRAGVTFTRYAFTLDGPALAEQLRTTMQQELAHRGELPVGLELAPPAAYAELTGEGELWVAADGLPLRQTLTMTLPGDDGAATTTTMTVDFADYGQRPGLLAQGWHGMQTGTTPAALQQWGLTVLLPLALILGIVVALIRLRHPAFHTGVTLTMIGVLVLGPFQQQLQVAQFLDTQIAAAAERDATQAARDTQQAGAAAPAVYNPHVNPLAPPTQRDTANDPADLPVAAVPPLYELEADDGTDSDGDGLTDVQEIYLGTEFINLTLGEVLSGTDTLTGTEIITNEALLDEFLIDAADSDSDGIPDGTEVAGFEYPPGSGQHWYLDPLEIDTNQDGQDDFSEWGYTLETSETSTTTVLLETPLDTDNDGEPDLFDHDNDGDGVADYDDLSPNTTVDTVPADEAFALNVPGLQANSPVNVDIQLRPSEDQHLWLTRSVFDWPEDKRGPIQDSDGGTFGTAGSAADGDMRLVPMLEITIDTSGNQSTNLPLTDSISVELHGTTDTVSGTVTLQDNGTDLIVDGSQMNGSYDRLGIVPLTEARCTDMTQISLSGQALNTPAAGGTLTDTTLRDVRGFAVFALSGSTSPYAVRACTELPAIVYDNASGKLVDTPLLQNFYGTIVRDLDESGTTKLLYVPLSVTNDSATRNPTALQASLLYWTDAAGSWPPQQMKLAWAVTALVDICERYKDGECREYSHLNVPQVIHHYADAWTLTGLNVREANGTDVAFLYEDPTVDPDLERLNALLYAGPAIQSAFVIDATTVSDLATAFDRDARTIATPQVLVDHPELDILQVEATTNYAFRDAMAHDLATRGNAELLDRAFLAPVTANPTVLPHLLFTIHERARAANLDQLGSVVAWDSAQRQLTMDMTDAPPLDLKAVRMAVYERSEISWTEVRIDTYWDRLAELYPEEDFALDGPISITDDSDAQGGAQFLVQSYMAALVVGQENVLIANGAAPPLATFIDDTNFWDAYTMTIDVSDLWRNIVDDFLAMFDSVNEVNQIVQERAASGDRTPPKLRNAYKKAWEGLFGRLQATEVPTGELESFYTNLLGKFKFAENSRWAKFKVHLMAPLKVGLTNYFLRFVAPIGIVATTIIFTVPQIREWFSPENKTPGRYVAAALLGVAGGSSILYYGIIKPLHMRNYFILMNLYNNTMGDTAWPRLATQQIKSLRTAAVVTTVIAAAVTTGFFIAALIQADNPTEAQIAAGSWGASIVVLTLTLLVSTGFFIAGIVGAILTIVGTVIVAIIGLIDLFAFLFGADWSINGWLVSQIYKYQLRANIDQLFFEETRATLVHPEQGMVAGNQMEISMVVNTRIGPPFRDPEQNERVPVATWRDNGTLRFYTNRVQDMLATAVDHRLSSMPEAIDVERGNRPSGATADSLEEHIETNRTDIWEYNGWTYTRLPMQLINFTNQTPVSLTTTLEAGINFQPSVYLNSAYAITVRECFIGCWREEAPEIDDSNPLAGSQSYLGEQYVFDVLPATLDEFVALEARGSGYGFAWDEGFGAAPDADGDGLRSTAFQGTDPDDTRWDTDGDGLSDLIEAQLRAGEYGFVDGIGIDIRLDSADSDGDGLSDYDEVVLHGTRPDRQDTDADGRSDKEEVDGYRLPITDLRAAGVTYVITNIHVTSDPRRADSDGDGLSDTTEWELADAYRTGDLPPTWYDIYHPRVPNTNPVDLQITLDDQVGANDGIVTPNTSLAYTTTATLRPNGMTYARPTLQTDLGADLTGTDQTITFDPVDTGLLTTPVTLQTQGEIVVGTTPDPQAATLTSQFWARTGLSRTLYAWVMRPLVQALDAEYTAVAGTDLTPLPGSPESYLQATQLVDTLRAPDSTALVQGDVRLDALGQVDRGGLPELEGNDEGNRPAAQLDTIQRVTHGQSGVQLACNNAGQCLVVWAAEAQCGTFKLDRIVFNKTADSDNGLSGDVEPYVVRKWPNGSSDNSTAWNPDVGNDGYHDNGANAPDVAYPNKTWEFCQGNNIVVEFHEQDGGGTSNWDHIGSLSVSLDDSSGSDTVRNDYNCVSTGGGHVTCAYGNEWDVEYTITPPRSYHIQGALIDTDGTVIRQYDADDPISGADRGANQRHHHPTVASNGGHFLVSWSYRKHHTNQTAIKLRRVWQSTGHLSDLLYDEGWADHDPTPRRASALIGINADTYLLAYETADQAGLRLARVRHSTGEPFGDKLTIDRAAPTTAAPVLAYSPDHLTALLVYQDANEIQAHLLADPATTLTSAATRTVVTQGRDPRVSYDPGQRAFVVGWIDAQGVYRVQPLDATGGQALRPPLPLASGLGDPALGAAHSLACSLGETMPLAHWSFEELPTTLSFADSTPHGHTATALEDHRPRTVLADANPVVFSNYALAFDGDAYLSAPVDLPEDQGTIALWFQTDQTDQGLLSLTNGAARTSTGHDRNIWLDRAGNACFRLWHDSTTHTHCTSGTNYADGQWHHLAATYGGPRAQVQLYLDGVASPAPASMATSSTFTAQSHLLLGYTRYHHQTSGFTGQLDAVQLFANALPAVSIQQLATGSDPAPACVAVAPHTADATTALPTPDANLVGWWPFDAQQADGSYRNQAAATGAATTTRPPRAVPARSPMPDSIVPPYLGSVPANFALAFDGINDRLTTNSIAHLIESRANYGTDQDFTVAFRVWADPQQHADGTRGIISKYTRPTNGSGTPFPFTISVRAGRLQAMRSDGTHKPFVRSPGRIDDGQWHHAAFVRREGQLQLYLDGALVATTPDTTTGPTTNNAPLHLGTIGGTEQAFRGSLDELFLDDRALTPSEIQQLAQGGEPQEGLFVPFNIYWPLSDTVSTLAGECTNSQCPNHIALRAMAPTATQMPSFDGNDDYLRIDNAGALLADDYTVSFWLYADFHQLETDPFILNKWDATTETNPLSIRYLTDGPDAGKLQAYTVNDTRSPAVVSHQPLAVGRWHQVTVMYQQNTALTLYLNGVYQDQVNLTNGSLANDRPIYLASNEQGKRNFRGLIDDLRIWNTALPAEAVSQASWPGHADPHDPTSFPDQSVVGAHLRCDEPGICPEAAPLLATAQPDPAVHHTLTFDGDDYVYSEAGIDGATPAAPQSMLLTFWFRTDQPTGGLFATTDTLPTADNTTHDRDLYLQDGRLCARLWQTSGTEVVCSQRSDLADGQWHQVGYGYRAGQPQQLFIDGQVMALETPATFDSSDFLAGPDQQHYVVLGYSPQLKAAAGHSGFFTGQLADVRVGDWDAATAPRLTAPRHWWTFDDARRDADTLTLRNEARGGATIRCTGDTCPTTTTGAPHEPRGTQALAFDGIDDRLVAAPPIDLVGQTQATLAAWVYPTATPDDTAILLGQEATLLLGRSTTGTLRYSVATEAQPDWRWADTQLRLPQDSWSHVAFVYDAAHTGTLRVAVNGVVVHTAPATSPLAHEQDYPPDQNQFWLGHRQRGFNEPFAGHIDAVVVLAEALPTFTLQQLAGGQTATACLVGAAGRGGTLQRCEFGLQPQMSVPGSIQARTSRTVQVDSAPPELPTIHLATAYPATAGATVVGLEANDDTQIARLETRLCAGQDVDCPAAPWTVVAEQLPSATTTITPSALVAGWHTLQLRAVDAVERVSPVASASFLVDATPPSGSLDITGPLGVTHHPDGRVTVDLAGQASDGTTATASGLETVMVQLQGQQQAGNTAQTVTLDGAGGWQHAYQLRTWQATDRLGALTGPYTATLTLIDRVGQRQLVTETLAIDTTAPQAQVQPDLAASSALTTTLGMLRSGTLTGVLTDTGTVASGVAGLELSIIPQDHLPLDPQDAAGACTGSTCPQRGAASPGGPTLTFDGIDDALVLTDTLQLGAADYTIGLWFRAAPTGQSQTLLAATQVQPGQEDHGVILALQPDGRLRYLHRFDPMGTSGGAELGSSASYADDQWHQLVAVRADDTLTLYVDGQEVAQGSGAQRETTALHVTLGQLGATMASRSFGGDLAGVRVYPRALSSAEVAALQPQAATLAETGADVRASTWTLDVGVPATASAADVALVGHTTDVLGNTQVRLIWQGPVAPASSGVALDATTQATTPTQLPLEPRAYLPLVVR